MIKFVSFERVVGEKFLGVASVVYDGKIMLRYKVFPAKEGKGVFFSTGSIKKGESYLPAFEFDSNFLKNDVERCIREYMEKESVSVGVSDSDMPF